MTTSAPGLTGKIVVTGLPRQSGESAERCGSGDNGVDLNCFNEELRSVVRSKGIEAAFGLLATRYVSDKDPAACHWSAHQIGDEVYRQESGGAPFAFARSSYYCGYGFYHGYLEALLRTNPDPQIQKTKILAFCDSVEKTFRGESKDNCFHGIGSGFTENPPPQHVYGNIATLTAPGLKACDVLFGGTGREWEVCTTGVFAVPANFMSQNKYDFVFDPADPFVFCAKLPPNYHRACYGEFSAKMERITQGDLSKVASFLPRIKEPEYQRLVVRVAAAVMLQRVARQASPEKRLMECRSIFEGDLQYACLDGVVWGFLYHGPLNHEHEQALNFCAEPALASEDREFCYTRLFARINNMFPPEKARAACSAAPAELRERCRLTTPSDLSS
ncbi:MAG: hypothetical protein HY006_02425 [Candidatus Sungbacteria bacterium]|nr:hypothetical protein [Candidatus Sungbacteria bacterium]